MPDWSDLRFLLEVARSGTLAAAARKLDVDDTTVGRRLTTLERDFGARLVTRTPDGFVLTDAGDAVRAAAEEMERAFLRGEQQAMGADRRPAGLVRVATTEMLAEMVVVPALAGLRRRQPNVRVDLLTGTARLDIARREADVALRYVRPEGGDLVVRRAGAVGYAIYASKAYLADHGRPPPDRRFAGHDLVDFDSAALGWRRGGLGGEPVREARFVLRSNSAMALIAAVRQGLGIGPLPCCLADPDRSLVRVPDGGPVDRVQVWIVVHPDVHQTSKVRAVLDAIEARMSEIAGVLEA
ncbi:MAG: LysR family transcriptional regulator [Myxococcales bacterium]|nr:LysR family transcriptional regulator [Myxococcales bacterium]